MVNISSTVNVLMSTYNGIRYIREQLTSIYAQEDVKISLLVRDDGSSDDTCNLLEEEKSKGCLEWYTGERLGPAMSFWNLLCTTSDADYYAFADQDDVWATDKLKIALEAIRDKSDLPALYFCQTQLVDEKLNKLDNVILNPLLTYGEALAYQFVGGCTMVFNKALRQQLVKYTPKYMRMHDIWIYDVAMAIGAFVYFDSVPHIYYRQHADNAVGQIKSFRFVCKARLERLNKKDLIRSKTAEELWKGYADMMLKENRKLTLNVINYRKCLSSKLHLLLSKDLQCGDRFIGMTSKISILINIF